jgi:hypothetical protein
VKQANSPNQKNVYISQLEKQSQVSNAASAHTHDVHPIPPQRLYHLSFSFLFFKSAIDLGQFNRNSLGIIPSHIKDKPYEEIC